MKPHTVQPGYGPVATGLACLLDWELDDVPVALRMSATWSDWGEQLAPHGLSLARQSYYPGSGGPRGYSLLRALTQHAADRVLVYRDGEPVHDTEPGGVGVPSALEWVSITILDPAEWQRATLWKARAQALLRIAQAAQNLADQASLPYAIGTTPHRVDVPEGALSRLQEALDGARLAAERESALGGADGR